MAKRNFRIGGILQSWGEYIQAQKDNNHSDFVSITDERDVVLKVGKDGSMEPVTGEPSADDIVFSGSKSNLRRMADMERNISILAAKLTTTDGEATNANDDDFDTVINKDTKFKRGVRLGDSSSDDIYVGGSLNIASNLTLGSTAREVIQDIAIKPMLTGNTESGITVTYDDGANEIDFTVTSAPKWATARTLSLSGDATGSVSIDGSANRTLSVTVADDSHNHVISNIDGLQAQLNTFVTTGSSQALSSQANAFYNEGNVLKLKRANGDIDSVNLATYLDDTNLARIVSGSMNSSGVATFSRDDNSSFTIDMSVLLDDTNLSRIVSAGWNTSNGVLTLTRNDSSTVAVDLDGRFDNYNGWDLMTDGTNRGRITSGENVNIVGGSNVSLAYSATNNTITINSTDTNTDTNTWRAIHDTPVNGATTTSISSNWAFDNVKKAVPSNAVFTDTNTWRGISDTPANDSGNSISRKWAQTAFVGASASNDTITFTKGDGTTTSVTTSDANSNTYVTGASFNTSNGILTLSRNSGSVTVDLDGRFTDNGYADTMNQHVRTTDSPSFANVTASNFNGTATYAKYADLAERYAADAEYAEGTVMAFGGDAEVTAAAGYGSGKLAGVVSHKPAVAMNAEAGDNATHPFIALQGRVPVRVEGDVKKGDILVASDVAGLAAVWMDENTDPRMTAYIGIAISDSVDGMVEVKVGK